jgi:hypothetical protein
MRAALTRQIPAIRDFFDIWYVRTFGEFDFSTQEFCSLVETKLSEVGPVYTSDTAYDMLERQIETDLIPVLHDEYDFGLREVYDFVQMYRI